MVALSVINIIISRCVNIPYSCYYKTHLYEFLSLFGATCIQISNSFLIFKPWKVFYSSTPYIQERLIILRIQYFRARARLSLVFYYNSVYVQIAGVIHNYIWMTNQNWELIRKMFWWLNTLESGLTQNKMKCLWWWLWELNHYSTTNF